MVAGIWLCILSIEIALGFFFTLFTHDIWTAGASILLYMVGYSLITPVSPTILSVCYYYSNHIIDSIPSWSTRSSSRNQYVFGLTITIDRFSNESIDWNHMSYYDNNNLCSFSFSCHYYWSGNLYSSLFFIYHI